MELFNKVALVTGAGSGIGRGTALAFAKEGACVIVGDINTEAAKNVSKEIEGLGRDTLAVKVDVSNGEEVAEMVEKALDRLGKIDILVNCAGVLGTTLHSQVFEMKEEVWDKVLDVNLKGQFLCSREVIKSMMEHKYGRIVNIASLWAITGGHTGGVSPYCASKAGVVAFTKTLAKEGAAFNIRVNAIAPGYIDTPLTRKSMDAALIERVISQQLIKRAGKPEDIAEMALFLVSDRSNFITGKLFIVDGGWLYPTAY